ncbi:hypothetical protein ABE511_09975 [Stenotrophomonas sp. TWI410]
MTIGIHLQALLDRHGATVLIRPVARAYDDAVSVGSELDPVVGFLCMRR